MRSRDKLAAARLMAVQAMPYFRAAMLTLVPKKTPGLGTFGVTKNGVLLWDPAALERWSVEETAGVLVHEISHLLRDHNGRHERMAAEPELWNIAGDLEINDDLAKTKLRLPEDGVMPVKMRALPIVKKLGLRFDDNLTAEEYYRELERLPRTQVAVACGGDGDQDDGDGDEQRGKTGQGVGRGRCGGCAGQAEPGEGEHEGGSGRSQVELERVKRQVAEDIRREAERGRGTVPGGWVRWADQQLKPPQIPWRQKLSRAVRAAVAYRPGAVDYHWTRPSRRQAGVGYGPGKPIMPALRAPVPRVAVIIDTSGSMGTEELTEAMSETNGVLKAVGANIDFCACDAAVQHIKPVRNWRDVSKLMTGGGGTDFRPPLEAMAKRKPRPDVVIFVTDGCGPAPATPPPFKVVWVLVGEHKQKPTAGDWRSGEAVAYGEFVEVKRGGEEAAA